MKSGGCKEPLSRFYLFCQATCTFTKTNPAGVSAPLFPVRANVFSRQNTPHFAGSLLKNCIIRGFENCLVFAVRISLPCKNKQIPVAQRVERFEKSRINARFFLTFGTKLHMLLKMSQNGGRNDMNPGSVQKTRGKRNRGIRILKFLLRRSPSIVVSPFLSFLSPAITAGVFLCPTF